MNSLLIQIILFDIFKYFIYTENIPNSKDLKFYFFVKIVLFTLHKSWFYFMILIYLNSAVSLYVTLTCTASFDIKCYKINILAL
jgi:hypothetical protein